MSNFLNFGDVYNISSVCIKNIRMKNLKYSLICFYATLTHF